MTTLGALTARSVAGSNFSTFIVPFRYRMRPRAWLDKSVPRFVAEDDAPNKALLVEARRKTLTGAALDEPEAAAIRIDARRQYLTGETRGIVFGSDSAETPLFAPLRREVRFFHLDRKLQLRWYTDKPAGVAERYFDLPEVSVRVVLFDIATASRTSFTSHDSAASIGFLLVRVAASEAMTTADLLDMNEKFRLLHYQHEGQRKQLHDRNSAADAPSGMFKYLGFALSSVGQRSSQSDPDRGSVPLWADLLALPLQVDGVPQSLESDLSCYPDDRAFVASHLCAADAEWDLATDSALWKLWHQQLYVESTEAPWRGWLTAHEMQWIDQRTYRRWERDSRLFGFSSFSFGSLCAPDSFALATDHFEAMYLDQLLLVLYQRVAVFNFGRELSALSQAWKRDGWDEVQGKFADLRAAFGQFVNLYWFPVFTNQVQGLEMYEIARRELGNQDLFDELRSEMDGTWGFMEARSAAALNRGGAVLALAGLVCAYFGMSLFQAEQAGKDPQQLLHLQWISPNWPQIFGFVVCMAVVGVALDWRVYGGKYVRRLRRTLAGQRDLP